MYLQRLYFKDPVEKSMLLGRVKLWNSIKAAVTCIADHVQISLWVYLKNKTKFLLRKCKNSLLVNIHVYTHTYLSSTRQGLAYCRKLQKLSNWLAPL